MGSLATESKPVQPPYNCGSWKSAFARRIASQKISEEFEYFARFYELLNKEGFPGDEAVRYALEWASKMKKPTDLRDDKKIVTKLDPGSKVCIVGAGMSGLYIAMILDHLKIKNLSYEILEGSDRVGGRVYTHRFSEKKHDYYDVGAMRFPRIPIMDKTFKLFEYLGQEKVPLIPYYLNSPRDDKSKKNQPSRYNDKTIIGDGVLNADNFQVSEKFGGRIMPELVEHHKKYLTEVFEPFKQRLRDNWTKGFQALMKYDQYSVRGFMMSHGITPIDDYYSIQWLETLTDGSGLYDQAFAEGIIDDMDFDYYTGAQDVDWKCIDGGAELVPKAMNATLEKPLKEEDLGKRVTKIRIDRDEHFLPVGPLPMKVKVAGEPQEREYATVFATPTLACLQRMDLTELELLYEQKDALRSLHYDTASKVGMQFKYAWWIKYGIEGGLGKTDLPLRCCVYPSYNLDDADISKDAGGPAVLLCSYSWSQDAARMGSLMKGDWEKEVELKEMLINNLTSLHLENARIFDKNITYHDLHDEINKAYIKHHAFDWHNHEYSSGAYGKFGPGQFSNLYSALTCPTADSRFHFVGEAVSAHHGWIVGALDSAHQAVINFLRRFNLADKEKELAKMKWLGREPDELDKETAVKKVILGYLGPDFRLSARGEIEKQKSDPISSEAMAEVARKAVEGMGGQMGEGGRGELKA